jgi:hypothetical protein
MKKIFSFMAIAGLALFSLTACAQDKSKRPSPPAKAEASIETGAKISINYSQPAIKGRTIGKDLEPKQGEVWRTGANEATVFEVSNDVTVEGEKLAAGKYALFTIFNGDECTLIFNKTWNQWGAYEYKADNDALRVKVKVGKGEFAEKMTFTVAANGKVTLNWGDLQVDFNVK